MPNPDTEIGNIANALNTAIARNDYGAILSILDRLAGLQEQSGGPSIVSGPAPHGFRQTHNVRLNPITPHADQCIQRAVWKLAGSVCGRCTATPRYWRVTFDFAIPDGHTWPDVFTGPARDFDPDTAHWFGDPRDATPSIILKRGPMILPPVSISGDPAGDFNEAVQQRHESEYSFCYWKLSRNPGTFPPPPKGPPPPLPSKNVAWFLFYGFMPQPGSDPPLIEEPNMKTDSRDNGAPGSPGWILTLIENERTVATGEGGTTWDNSYSPLVSYRLVPRTRRPYEPDDDTDRQTPFRCLGTNTFEQYENNLTGAIPRSIAILTPFYP
jgi:hypothetical protein